MTSEPTATKQEPAASSPWPRVAAVVALLTAVVSVLLIAFTWPSVRSEVHDVPIAVAGAPAAVEDVTTRLDSAAPGAFDVTAVSDTAAAQDAITHRDVYGAIDVSGSEPQVLIASAASPVIAQSLRSVAASLGGSPTASSAAVGVSDVVPLPAEDPRGAGLAAASLPLVIGGLLAAVALTNLVAGTSRRLVGALAYSVTAGLAITAILHFWFGALGGSYWADTAAVTLSIATTASVVLGLELLLGAPGIAVGSVLMMLIGNPLSGASSAPEMLPGFSGELGQLLPPGAGASLLRSVSFFDGNGAAGHVVVLTCWLAAGLALVVLGGIRRSRESAAELATAAA